MQNLYYTRLKKNCYCKRPNFFFDGRLRGQGGREGIGTEGECLKSSYNSSAIIFRRSNIAWKTKTPRVSSPWICSRPRFDERNNSKRGLTRRISNNASISTLLLSFPFENVTQANKGLLTLREIRYALLVSLLTAIYKYEGEPLSSFSFRGFELPWIGKLNSSVFWQSWFIYPFDRIGRNRILPGKNLLPYDRGNKTREWNF